MRRGDYPRALRKFGNADVIVANTPGSIDRVQELGWPSENHMISNFTDAMRVPPVSRGDYDTPEDSLLLVSTGRFVERKAFDVLIRATAKLPNVYFWLVGDGDEAANLRALVEKLGVSDRVRFLGWQADVRPFIAAADVFSMSSRHEPLGNVVLEAWAQDVPVITTMAEGPRWFMRDGENGLVVEINAVDAVVSSMQKIHSDPALRATLISGGRAALDGMFSEGTIVSQYLRLFARHRPDADALIAQHLDNAALVSDEVIH